MFFRKLCGSKQYQKEKKVTALKLCIQLFLIVLNAFWMYHTWRLIELDHEMADKRFNPYAVLDLVMPRLPSDGFNAPAVRRAYRNLAKKYHPDKIYLLSEAEQAAAPKRWLEIQKGYETLTEEDKFNNWVEYGNPEGSLVKQSIDIAIPSWVFDPKNQVQVLSGFFGMFVIVPMFIIYHTKSGDIVKDCYQNGIDRRSKKLMMPALFAMLDKNMKRKKKQIDDEQFIEVLEASVEMRQLNEGKKINIRDILKQKIENKEISDKFKDVVAEVDNTLPKLVSVLLETMSEKDFVQGLMMFNSQSDGKVKFNVDSLFTQLVEFTDRVVKNKKNGYLGYEVQVRQADSIA